MKRISLAVIALLITAIINYILFVPSSPVNLLLYLITDNNDFFLITDMLLSNLMFLGIYKALKGVGAEKTLSP